MHGDLSVLTILRTRFPITFLNDISTVRVYSLFVRVEHTKSFSHFYRSIFETKIATYKCVILLGGTLVVLRFCAFNYWGWTATGAARWRPHWLSLASPGRRHPTLEHPPDGRAHSADAQKHANPRMPQYLSHGEHGALRRRIFRHVRRVLVDINAFKKRRHWMRRFVNLPWAKVSAANK
jgi:hypothetical protein